MTTMAALLIAVAAGHAGASAPLGAAPACTAEVKEHADEGNLHVPLCSQLQFGSNPPASGNHYAPPYWAAYRTYAAPVPAGFLVHDLEHGAVVIGYNCPEGCAEEVARAQAWINGLGQDPICPGSPHKIILAPNPQLDVRWAAAAWAWTWKASCPDTASLGAFFRAHYGKTAEAGVCGGGVDRSASGWCPTAIPAPAPEAAGGLRAAAPGGILLWTGSLPARTRLRVEAALPDGTLLGVADLGIAGPGHARAAWDGQAFRKRHPGAGTLVLMVRTSSGRLLARRLDPRPEP